jgi:hypothetical protein
MLSYVIVAIVFGLGGFIAGALVYRSNEKNVTATVTAVKTTEAAIQTAVTDIKKV